MASNILFSILQGWQKMSDSDIKLERINDHLYHETGEKGKIKWEKKPELLNIKIKLINGKQNVKG